MLPRGLEEAPQLHRHIDALEVAMMKLPEPEIPTKHTFAKGLYSREIRVQAGVLLTSRIHLVENFYVISQGAMDVWVDGKGWERITAPYTGLTKPGTRRVAIIVEDIVWTTFHPMTDERDIDKVEAMIYADHYDHIKGHERPTVEQFIALLGEQGGS